MIITITGYYGYQNFGDDLMLYCLLNELCKEQDLTIRILGNQNLPEFITSYSNTEIFKFRPYSKLENLKVFSRAMRNSDILIWGGGTCFTDQDGVNIRYFLLAKLLLKKIAFLSIGVGKISGLRKVKTALISNLSNLITVRDKISYDRLNDICFHKRIHLTSDFSYLYPYNKISKGENSILISLHNLKNYGSDSQIKLRRDNLIGSIKKYAKPEWQFTILSLATVDNDENELFFKILEKKGYNVILTKTEDFKQRIKIISSATFYYTERLHGFVVGHFNNIPLVPFIYSPKFKYFMHEESVSYPSVSFKDLGLAKEVFNYTNQTYEHRANHLGVSIKNAKMNINLLNKLLRK